MGEISGDCTIAPFGHTHAHTSVHARTLSVGVDAARSMKARRSSPLSPTHDPTHTHTHTTQDQHVGIEYLLNQLFAVQWGLVEVSMVMRAANVGMYIPTHSVKQSCLLAKFQRAHLMSFASTVAAHLGSVVMSSFSVSRLAAAMQRPI